MQQVEKAFKRYELKVISILIPIVGIFIAFIYGISRTQTPWSQAIYFTIHSILITAIIWLGCFLIVVYLWRKYPWEHNPAKHLIIEIVAILSYVSLLGFIITKLEQPLINKCIGEYSSHNSVLDFFITLLITFFITSIHEAAFFYKQWKYNFSKSARLEKDNIEAKYETLKSQINPHFLFNSLNSLTVLVDNNKQAVDYIQNLSEFLRYVLKSRDRELVLVREEIKILQKYLSLQKSRFGENLQINLNVDEKYYHFSLPPLVLQMLAENCIKHNIVSKDKPLSISIKAEKENLLIQNNLQRKNEVSSTQQGLKNIADRLAFFTSRELEIIETPSTFTVVIPLLTVEL